MKITRYVSHTILLALIASVATLALSPAWADTQPTGISVAGECFKKVARDRGAVTVSSSLVAPTAREASQKTIAVHERIKVDIQALALRDLSISTIRYETAQECTWGKVGNVCTGYRTTISTRFETPAILQLEEILAVAAKHSAEDVGRLETFASPELLKAERESGLETATKNAQAKAEKIASGAGVKLGKIISISENTGGQHYLPMERGGLQGLSASKAGPSIDAAPIDLQVSVNAIYAIQ